MEIIGILSSVIGLVTSAYGAFSWLRKHPLNGELVKKFDNWLSSPCNLIEKEGMLYLSITPKGIMFGFVEFCRVVILFLFIH